MKHIYFADLIIKPTDEMAFKIVGNEDEGFKIIYFNLQKNTVLLKEHYPTQKRAKGRLFEIMDYLNKKSY